jgi:hypothetical protein
MGVHFHLTLLVNSKWLITPALHTTFETQTDQGVVTGDPDL